MCPFECLDNASKRHTANLSLVSHVSTIGNNVGDGNKMWSTSTTCTNCLFHSHCLLSFQIEQCLPKMFSILTGLKNITRIDKRFCQCLFEIQSDHSFFLHRTKDHFDSCAAHFATQFHDANRSPANVEELHAAASGKATPSVQSKLLPPKTAPPVPKRELQILKHFRSDPQLVVNSNNKIYGAYGKATTHSTDESINDERGSPMHEVVKDFTRCNVCLADAQLEALQGLTKRDYFLFASRALALIPTIYYKSVTLCCSA